MYFTKSLVAIFASCALAVAVPAPAPAPAPVAAPVAAPATDSTAFGGNPWGGHIWGGSPFNSFQHYCQEDAFWAFGGSSYSYCPQHYDCRVSQWGDSWCVESSVLSLNINLKE